MECVWFVYVVFMCVVYCCYVVVGFYLLLCLMCEVWCSVFNWFVVGVGYVFDVWFDELFDEVVFEVVWCVFVGGFVCVVLLFVLVCCECVVVGYDVL